MLPTIRLIFDRKHKRELEVSVYYDGRCRYFGMGVRLPQGAKFTNGVVNGCLDAPQINKQLNHAICSLRDQLCEMGDDICLGDLSLRPEHGEPWAAWAEAYIADSYNDSYSRLRLRSLKLMLECGMVDNYSMTRRNGERFTMWLWRRMVRC